MKDAISVDLKLDADALHSFWGGSKVDRKAPKAPVIPGAFALALQNMNEHAPLLIDRGGEHLARFDGNGGVARNDHVHQAAKSFEAEREGRDIGEQNIWKTSGQNLRVAAT